MGPSSSSSSCAVFGCDARPNTNRTKCKKHLQKAREYQDTYRSKKARQILQLNTELSQAQSDLQEYRKREVWYMEKIRDLNRRLGV